MTQEEALLWIGSATTFIVGLGAARFAVARHIVNTALERYKPQLDIISDFNPIASKQLPEDVKSNFDRVRIVYADTVKARQKINDFKMDVPQIPKDVYQSADKFQAYMNQLMGAFKVNLGTAFLGSMTADVAMDAIFNAALLRAFPGQAVIAGAGEISDIVLPPAVIDFIDQTGVIDLTASFLQDIAGVLSDQIVVSVGETLADTDIAVFTLCSIANRERKMIQAGYSKPGESALYGLLDYGGRVAGAFLGGKVGGTGGGIFGGPVGAAVGAIFGAISGAVAAKAMFVKALKLEIEGYANEYQADLASGKENLSQIRDDIVNKTHAALHRAAITYKEKLAKMPGGIETQPEIAVSAMPLAAAYRADLTAAFQLMDEKAEEFKKTIGKPGAWDSICGADWDKAVAQRADDIVAGQKEQWRSFVWSCSEKIATADPCSVIMGAAQMGMTAGPLSEAACKVSNIHVAQALTAHDSAMDKWANSCSKAWNKSAKNTRNTYEGERKRFVKFYNALRNSLDFQKRRMLSKAARLDI